MLQLWSWLLVLFTYHPAVCRGDFIPMCDVPKQTSPHGPNYEFTGFFGMPLVLAGKQVWVTCTYGWCVKVEAEGRGGSTEEDTSEVEFAKKYKRKCGWNQEWSGGEPTCVPCVCSLPVHEGHGTVVNTSIVQAQYELGETLTLECPPLHLTFGEPNITCDGNDWWRGLDKFICREIRCSRFEVEHGHLEPLQRVYLPRDTVQVQCFNGYENLGPINRTCTENWVWQPDAISVCRSEVQRHEEGYGCDDPGVPIGGKRITYDPGRKATYVCKVSHMMEGNATILCNEHTRQWTTGPPRCYSKYYVEPAEQVVRRISNTLGHLGALDLNPYPRVETSERSFGDVATPGDPLVLYIVIDQSSSISQEDFSQSMLLVKALIQKMRVFPLWSARQGKAPVRIGLVSFSGEARILLFPWQDIADDKDRLIVHLEEHIKQMNTGTHLFDALDKVIDSINQGFRLYRANYENWYAHLEAPNLKKGVLLITDGLYNIGGDPKQKGVELKALGYNIYAISINKIIGKRTTDGEKVLKTLVQDPDEDIVDLKSYAPEEVATKLLNLQIEFSNCGWSDYQGCERTTPHIRAGNTSVERDFPWMVQLFHHDLWDPQEFVTNSRPIDRPGSGGTLISPQWVLTAAHNVIPRSTKRSKQADKILITYGSNYKNGCCRRVLVDQIFVHNFSYPLVGLQNSTFENDIALLKLAQPIKFTEYAHSICLPKPVEGLPGQDFDAEVSDEDMYRMETVGHISGYGRDETGRVGTLKSACVVLAPCVLNSNDKFCAGLKTSEQDADKGDSGGPLARRLARRTDNRDKRHVQIGITSHKEADDDYTGEQVVGRGGYVKLLNYMDWIRQIIAENTIPIPIEPENTTPIPIEPENTTPIAGDV